MDPRIAACRQLNVAVRQTEELSNEPSRRANCWFYIVDREATAAEGEHALQDGSVVLGVSATEADANAVAALDGLGVVYYAELGEAERRRMTARIDEARHRNPERTEAPETNEERSRPENSPRNAMPTQENR